MDYSGRLMGMYQAMSEQLGPSGWWPGDNSFEICIGAILTQNTSWGNVEKAISSLKNAKVLTPQIMHSLTRERLAELIRPAGYCNIKAGRIMHFLDFLYNEAEDSLETLTELDTHTLRQRLLSINGIGQETADAMLLYAFQRTAFVVDAYTARIMIRHSMVPEETDYQELQALFMDALPEDIHLYNEFHALIVRTGKKWCKKKAPLCETCPLQSFL